MPRGVAPKLRNRRVPPAQARRRGQGVITGLAAKRPFVLLKRGPFNRAAVNQVMQDSHRTLTQRLGCVFLKVAFDFCFALLMKEVLSTGLNKVYKLGQKCDQLAR